MTTLREVIDFGKKTENRIKSKSKKNKKYFRYQIDFNRELYLVLVSAANHNKYNHQTPFSKLPKDMDIGQAAEKLFADLTKKWQ